MESDTVTHTDCSGTSDCERDCGHSVLRDPSRQPSFVGPLGACRRVPPDPSPSSLECRPFRHTTSHHDTTNLWWNGSYDSEQCSETGRVSAFLNEWCHYIYLLQHVAHLCSCLLLVVVVVVVIVVSSAMPTSARSLGCPRLEFTIQVDS